MRAMRLDDFDYDLPLELIAQAPAEVRSGSRLLHMDGQGVLQDLQFPQIAQCLRAGDLLVVNDTRVIKARLLGRKGSGGQVEVMVERIVNAQELWAQIRASHAPKPGSVLYLGDDLVATVLERSGELFHLRFEAVSDVLSCLDQQGRLPLPPYITHVPQAADETRYQTVYAKHDGAVAAPTAGLHFDEALLANLRSMGVAVATLTLHVGAGTFQPVRVDRLADHVMHRERYALSQATVDAVNNTRAHGGRVIAVGTTSLRALESAMLEQRLIAGESETQLFIVPGYRFQVVDALVTNFHLSKSTLLMLVSAFGGVESIRHAYQHAIEQRYRFFSYGDAMFIEREQTASSKG
jgi:S-adenosylmethionine:tRNA ribosyltransferase-isomerase